MRGDKMAILLIGIVLFACDKLPTKKITGTVDFTGSGAGCGNLCMYKFNQDSTMSIYVYLNKENLKLSSNHKKYNIKDYKDDIRVVVTRYNRPSVNNFCSDFPTRSKAVRLQSWAAESGTLDITLSTDKDGESYSVNAIFDNLSVHDNVSDNMLDIPYIAFTDVHGGWFPG